MLGIPVELRNAIHRRILDEVQAGTDDALRRRRIAIEAEMIAAHRQHVREQTDEHGFVRPADERLSADRGPPAAEAILPDGALGLLYPGGHIEMTPARPPALSPEEIDEARLLGLALVGGGE